MTRFSESIIGKIKQERIAPVPRWHFLLKNYVFWSLFGISVLLGSLSFGVMMHIVKFGDFDILGHLKGNVLTSTVMMLPYFWLASLCLFALVAFYNCKHTRHAYRFRRRWIIAGSVIGSFLFGGVFYALGFGQRVDMLMVKTLPFYSQSKQKARIELWQQPEQGLIIGRIIEVDVPNGSLVIEDSNGNNWAIDNKVKNEIPQKKESMEKKGKTIKVMGEKKSEHVFVAKEIRGCGDCDEDDNDNGGAINDNDMDDENANTEEKEKASIRERDDENRREENDAETDRDEEREEDDAETSRDEEREEHDEEADGDEEREEDGGRD